MSSISLISDTDDLAHHYEKVSIDRQFRSEARRRTVGDAPVDIRVERDEGATLPAQQRVKRHSSALGGEIPRRLVKRAMGRGPRLVAGYVLLVERRQRRGVCGKAAIRFIECAIALAIAGSCPGSVTSPMPDVPSPAWTRRKLQTVFAETRRKTGSRREIGVAFAMRLRRCQSGLSQAFAAHARRRQVRSGGGREEHQRPYLDALPRRRAGRQGVVE